jgi:hypothetical protein
MAKFEKKNLLAQSGTEGRINKSDLLEVLDFTLAFVVHEKTGTLSAWETRVS